MLATDDKNAGSDTFIVKGRYWPTWKAQREACSSSAGLTEPAQALLLPFAVEVDALAPEAPL